MMAAMRNKKKMIFKSSEHTWKHPKLNKEVELKPVMDGIKKGNCFAIYEMSQKLRTA